MMAGPKLNRRSRGLRVIPGVTLWGMSFLFSSGSAASESGSSLVERDVVTPVSFTASTSLTGLDPFVNSADAATVIASSRLRPMAAEISAPQTGSAGDETGWGDVLNITVPSTGVVAHQTIPSVSLAPSGATVTRNLSSYFSFPAVAGSLVQFNTVVGKFVVELYADDAPLNVANFLRHVNAGSYTNTFIHRSVPEFVIQGGGYYADSNISDVTRLGTAALEYKIPNYRGTLAMARGSDPNSAGSQWFINTVDNADYLKPLGEGYDGYTVIGRVLGDGLTVVDALAALPVYYLSEFFAEVPLYNYVNGSPLLLANLVTVYGLAEVPVYPTSAQADALITFTASSSNEAVVRVALSGTSLTLTSVGAGSATVTVRATESAGQSVQQQFSVTVAAPPSIIQSPVSSILVQGQTAFFEVQMSGQGSFEFQWFKDGEPLSAGGNLVGVDSQTLFVVGVSAESEGSYAVRVSNGGGSVDSTPAQLKVVDYLATHDNWGKGYWPGGVVQIDSRVAFSGAPKSVTWSVVLPDGWSYESTSDTPFTSSPTTGDSGLIEFSWTSSLLYEIEFSYLLRVPENATNEVSIVSMATISLLEDSEVLADPDPLIIPRSIHHTADTNGDFKLGLSELLRVIELYNTRAGSVRTGAYREVNGSVDDFVSDTRAATTLVTLNRYHSADTDRDAKLSLSELLRVIELYNTRSGSVRTGQYRQAESTSDGFTADP